jgi:hypothetical protein
MNLPVPPASYDARDQAETRRSLEQEDKRNLKRGYDIDARDTRTLLRSPNGHRWVQTIDDVGATTWTDLDA